MIRRQKKSRKFRGDRGHGYGAGKKHRGAGHRGGRGNAGAGKRGQQKKSMYLALGIKPIGKSGLRYKKQPMALNTINVHDISLSIDKWVSEGKAKIVTPNGVTPKGKAFRESGNKFQIDLKAHGYQKLLGAGKINKPVDIKVDIFSKKAEEKITKAGGKIIKKEKPSKEESVK